MLIILNEEVRSTLAVIQQCSSLVNNRQAFLAISFFFYQLRFSSADVTYHIVFMIASDGNTS